MVPVDRRCGPERPERWVGPDAVRVLAMAWLAVGVLLGGCTEDRSPREPPTIGVSTPAGPEVPTITWSLDTLAMIGSLEGEESELFGSLTGASILADGRFLVMDSQGSRVALFDEGGEHLSSISSTGEGPGELQLPTALAVSKNRNIFVMDRLLGRISRFALEGNHFEFEEMWPAPSMPQGVCVSDGALWVGVLREGRLAHRMGEDGTLEEAVGDAPDVPEMRDLGDLGELLVYPQLVRPVIHCDDGAGLMILVSGSHPLVQAYRSSGDRLWSMEMPDFTSFQSRQTETGGVTHSSHPERGSHFATGVVPWDDEHVLVQYEIRWENGEREPGVDSRLVEVATGAMVGRSMELPRILAGRGDRFLIEGSEVFPEVILVERHDWQE